MALLRRPNHRGYIGHSMFSLVSLAGSASVQTQVRRSSWHAIHAMRLDRCRRNRTIDKQRGQDQISGGGQRRRLEYPECGVEVAAGLLLMHLQIQHGMVWGGRRGNPPPPQGGPNLPVLLPKTFVASPMPGRGVPGRGLKSYQPLGSLCASPRARHNSDPGGG